MTFLSHEKLGDREVCMARGRPLTELSLSAGENNTLVEWKRRAKTSQALALRARIILQCAQGATNTEVAHRLRITKQTVGKWRGRFLEQRLDGLLDEPRPGTPRRMDDVELTRFSGHVILSTGGVHDAQTKTTVSGRVPAQDRRVGASRSQRA
jgi:transposase